MDGQLSVLESFGVELFLLIPDFLNNLEFYDFASDKEDEPFDLLVFPIFPMIEEFLGRVLHLSDGQIFDGFALSDIHQAILALRNQINSILGWPFVPN